MPLAFPICNEGMPSDFAGLKILIPTGAHRRFLSLRLLNKLASPLKGFYWRIRYRLHIR